MNLLITDINNNAGDGISRILYQESDFDLHVLSDEIKEDYSKGRINAYKTDFKNPKSLKETIYNIKPDVIIFSSDYGEIRSKDKQKMQHVNNLMLENFISAARVLESQLIVISNEFVFDGESGEYSEEALPSSSSYYGTTKHAMENLAIGELENSAIIRHSFLYGHNSFGYPDLTTDLIKTLETKKKFKIELNYYTNPCFVDEFAFLVLKIIEKKLSGIYHAAGPVNMTIGDFANAVADFYDLDSDLLQCNDIMENGKFGLLNYKSHTSTGVNFSTVKSGLIAMKYYMYGDKLINI